MKTALKTQLTELQKTREANRKLFATQEDQKISYEIQKDEEQEKAALQESNFGDKERTASVDAAIQYNGDQKQFTLISDVQGNQIDVDADFRPMSISHWRLFFRHSFLGARSSLLWEQMYISSRL